MSRDDLAAALAPHGLILRGGFNFAPDEAAPPGPSGAPAKSVLLVGQAGAAPWPHFLRWRQSAAADLANPLDTWSREVIGAVAEKFGARAVSPSDRPYLPFQQWAMRAEGLKPSPLGILMHPQYGLWHAYRGALLFDVEIPIQAPREVIHLCDLCVGKPCLKACPVDAYSRPASPIRPASAMCAGRTASRAATAAASTATPVPMATDYRYPGDAQAFHMAAFAR